MAASEAARDGRQLVKLLHQGRRFDNADQNHPRRDFLAFVFSDLHNQTDNESPEFRVFGAYVGLRQRTPVRYGEKIRDVGEGPSKKKAIGTRWIEAICCKQLSPIWSVPFHISVSAETSSVGRLRASSGSFPVS
jgi:hypothetical protein